MIRSDYKLDKLELLMEIHKLKVKNIAEMLNRHENTIRGKLKGKHLFTVPEGFILAKYFDTTIEDLFYDEDFDPKSLI